MDTATGDKFGICGEMLWVVLMFLPKSRRSQWDLEQGMRALSASMGCKSAQEGNEMETGELEEIKGDLGRCSGLCTQDEGTELPKPPGTGAIQDFPLSEHS